MLQHDWFFSDSIPCLMKSVMRWDEIGSKAIWHSWNTREANGCEDNFFVSNEDGKEKCARHYNAINEAGVWQLVNLPLKMRHSDFLSSFASEIVDPLLPIQTVQNLLLTEAFNNWSMEGESELEFFDSKQLNEFLSCGKSTAAYECSDKKPHRYCAYVSCD